MRAFLRYLLLFGLVCLVGCTKQPNAGLSIQRKALNGLVAEQWEYKLRTSPIYASILGDKRWNDKLDDFSQQGIEKDLREAQRFLARFEAIDTTGFPEQEALNKTLMVRDLRLQVEEAQFKPWEMPVSQFGGIHIDMPWLVSVLSFQNKKDYNDYISRLLQLRRAMDETTIQMRKGMADRLMPPCFLLQKVIGQANGIATQAPERSPFAHPFFNFPQSIAEADRKDLRARGLSAIREAVLPAYVKFTNFVRNEYAPNGRTEPGLWALPNGDARYLFAARRSTTTELSPEEIHQLGLAQVKYIEDRMRAVAKQLGYADLRSLNAAIASNPNLRAHSREEILDLYRKYIAQIYPKLPELFGRLPKIKLEVVPVETFREKDAAGAQYTQGTSDGSRSAHVEVNTGDFEKRSLLNVETTAYHEGVPGHHLQIAIAQQLPGLPPFRQQEYYTAFTEGWALYAERLGKELGFFQDPYSYYGHLQDEMLRAIRLVVDTGIHYKHWTRQQVVDFFHEHSAQDEPTVQAETDRYIAWPGQALGYKIGQLQILKLRQYAKDELQERFSLRAFHDEVLGAGALPLDLLSERIHKWVAGQNGKT
jgi:uncharacterized protein (DUF885 family)